MNVQDTDAVDPGIQLVGEVGCPTKPPLRRSQLGHHGLEGCLRCGGRACIEDLDLGPVGAIDLPKLGLEGVAKAAVAQVRELLAQVHDPRAHASDSFGLKLSLVRRQIPLQRLKVRVDQDGAVVQRNATVRDVSKRTSGHLPTLKNQIVASLLLCIHATTPQGTQDDLEVLVDVELTRWRDEGEHAAPRILKDTSATGPAPLQCHAVLVELGQPALLPRVLVSPDGDHRVRPPQVHQGGSHLRAIHEELLRREVEDDVALFGSQHANS
mmetsp:Transcript_91984/g.263486  ORF Transcript_91984/g.263486 Transcript_91984/m.263486 type:complete len:268 (-) Transcript_91984:133-936(-)